MEHLLIMHPEKNMLGIIKTTCKLEKEPIFSVNDFIKGYGEVYQGDFVENKRHGQGNLTYTSGSIYEGKWKDNQVFGQ